MDGLEGMLGVPVRDCKGSLEAISQPLGIAGILGIRSRRKSIARSIKDLRYSAELLCARSKAPDPEQLCR